MRVGIPVPFEAKDTSQARDCGCGGEDESNHLGEKTYNTYEKWKAAVKAAYPNARFEGNREAANAVPGGEWDGEVGVVYGKK